MPQRKVDSLDVGVLTISHKKMSEGTISIINVRHRKQVIIDTYKKSQWYLMSYRMKTSMIPYLGIVQRVCNT